MNEYISSPVFQGETISQTPLVRKAKKVYFSIKSSAAFSPRKQWFIHRVLRFPICRRSPFLPEPCQGQLEASHFETRPRSSTIPSFPAAPPHGEQCYSPVTAASIFLDVHHHWGAPPPGAHQPGPCPASGWQGRCTACLGGAHDSGHCPGTNWHANVLSCPITSRLIWKETHDTCGARSWYRSLHLSIPTPPKNTRAAAPLSPVSSSSGDAGSAGRAGSQASLPSTSQETRAQPLQPGSLLSLCLLVQPTS